MFEWSPLFEKLHLNDELNNLETCLKENKTFCNKDSTINFIYNEAGFDVPQPILNGAKEALNNGKTQYTLAPGISELREKIAEASISKLIQKVICLFDVNN